MKKILVGMSGGVDSSVSALLLKKDGYEVVGATMDLINSTNNIDAEEVCNKLNIKHVNIDFRNEFQNCIINYFIDEYKNCRTPNPCIECNKKLKFGLLYNYAKSNGIDYIATGHYARVEYSDKYSRYILRKASNLKKDQSYFLYNINKEILPFIIFPLENFNSKDEIRKIASDNELNVASKSDSQDICFISDGNYKKFLQDNGLPSTQGNVIFNGKIIGKHDGLYKYTVGQRKGLGIAYEEPLYVIGFNKLKNELIVGLEKDLYVSEFEVKKYNLLLIDQLNGSIKVNVSTRYKSCEYPATISPNGDNIKVIFDKPQKGVTSGQSAVFYVDDIVLGGGIII